jgi:hypothetical protein
MVGDAQADADIFLQNKANVFGQGINIPCSSTKALLVPGY